MQKFGSLCCCQGVFWDDDQSAGVTAAGGEAALLKWRWSTWLSRWRSFLKETNSFFFGFFRHRVRLFPKWEWVDSRSATGCLIIHRVGSVWWMKRKKKQNNLVSHRSQRLEEGTHHRQAFSWKAFLRMCWCSCSCSMLPRLLLRFFWTREEIVFFFVFFFFISRSTEPPCAPGIVPPQVLNN